MNQENHPAYERFINKLEASLQLVEELEEMLQKMHDARSNSIRGSDLELLDSPASVH